MTIRLAVLFAAVSIFFQHGASALAQQPKPAPASRPAVTVVLDTSGFWRMHITLKPPVIDSNEGPKQVLFKQAWLDTPTPPPPPNWMSADFDDGNWTRAPATRASRTPYLERLCLRGTFEVTDPAKVRGLKVSVGYHGGAIVYVNGKEIARSNVQVGPSTGSPSTSSGQVGGAALAEAYPAEAFVLPGGELIRRRQPDSPERNRRVALWDRDTGEVAIPPERLHKGVNVLAVEILRAPYDRLCAQPRKPEG